MCVTYNSCDFVMVSNSTLSNVYSCYDVIWSNNSITPELWDIPDGERLAALNTAIFTLFFISVGLPGNALIIGSILYQRLYREPTLILLLNLAVADFLVCALVMPFTVLSGFAGGFVLGGTDSTRCKWCKTAVVFVALCLFSLHILALMSIDRFIFIKFPMKYHRFVTGRKTVSCIIVVWILCIVVSLFPLFGFGDVIFGSSVSTCTPNFEHRTHVTSNINYMILLMAESVLPLSALIVTNIWVACIIRKHMKRIYSTGKQKNREQFTLSIMKRLEKEKNRKHLQLMRVFGAILLSHVLTWLPLISRTLSTAIKGNDDHPLWVFVFVYLSITSSAVFHPLIQACLVPEIRTQCNRFVAKMVCWLCIKDSESDSSCVNTPYCVCHPCGKILGLERSCSMNCFCLDLLNVTVLPADDLYNAV